MSGFTAEEIYRHGARIFFEYLHPDDLDEVVRQFKALFSRGESVRCRMPRAAERRELDLGSRPRRGRL